MYFLKLINYLFYICVFKLNMKITKEIGLLIGFLSLLTSNLYAQSLSHKWTNGIGDKSNDVGKSICVDALGNTYVLGYFTDSTDLDPSANVSKLIAKGSYDIFLAKYDVNGKFVWGKGIGGTDADFGNGIGFDGKSSLYVTGTFRGTVDFDPSVNTSTATSAGGDDIFIAKYDTSGNYYFVKRIGSSGNEVAQSIAVENVANGNYYITGYFAGTVDFDPSASTANLFANVNDVFIGKYSSAGNYVWAKKVGGTWDDYAQTITLDKNNNVFVSGRFNGTVNFNPAGLANITSSGGDDIFLAKYTSGGAYSWAIAIGSSSGTSYGDGRCVKTDNNGNVYLTGLLYGTLDFDFSNDTANLTSNGAEDIFIVKYDATGAFQWAGNMGSSGSDMGLGLAVDNNNDVYCTGFFQGTVDFDISMGTASETSSGNGDIFILKLNPNSAFKSVYKIGGANDDKGLALAIMNKTDLRITGFFSGTVDFDPSSSNNTITSKGLDDAFLIGFCGAFPVMPSSISVNGKICPNRQAVFSVINDTIASNYQWVLPSGWIGASTVNSISAKLGNTGGQVSVKAVNSCGVSSASTLNVTVVPTDVTVALNGTTLSSNEALANYLWLNCNNNYAAINGANSQSYTPTVSGKYAVRLDKFGCVDTSACITVYMLGLSNNTHRELNVYPNPGSGKFKLTIDGKETSGYKMLVRNYLGQTLDVQTLVVGEELYFELKSAEAGFYYLTIEFIDGSVSTKIISVVN